MGCRALAEEASDSFLGARSFPLYRPTHRKELQSPPVSSHNQPLHLVAEKIQQPFEHTASIPASRSPLTAHMSSSGKTVAVSRVKSLDATAVWPYDSILHFHPHVNTQHFSLYFELFSRLSVSLSAAYVHGLYPGTSISTHVSDKGVRVSEGAHRENLQVFPISQAVRGRVWLTRFS